ncbi:hypothetical protein D3C80_593500 [compost metagenome]
MIASSLPRRLRNASRYLSQSSIAVFATPDSIAAFATAIETSVIKRGSVGLGMIYSSENFKLLVL